MSEECIYEVRENHELPLIQNWIGESYYEPKFVQNPRKSWTCDNCGKAMSVGDGPKFGFKSYAEDNAWPLTNWCIDCEELDPRVKKALTIIRSGELDG